VNALAAGRQGRRRTAAGTTAAAAAETMASLQQPQRLLEAAMPGAPRPEGESKEAGFGFFMAESQKLAR
jgi:hypothetical protein